MTEEQKLAGQILKYFMRNPRAADSLEGVVQWRLLDQRIYQTVDEVSRSLDWLVSQGYLKKELRAATGAFFSLDDSKRLQVEGFLAGLETGSEEEK